MTKRLTKDSASVVEEAGEHKSLVQMLIEQNNRTLELLEKHKAENRNLISKLENLTKNLVKRTMH